MGLFGPSKKEKELQTEVDRLREMLLPEQQDILKLRKIIQFLEDEKAKAEKELETTKNLIQKNNRTIYSLDEEIKKKKEKIFSLETAIEMQEYGIYEPCYEFANSSQYKDKLTEIRDQQKQLIKKDLACAGDTTWTVNGNATQGKKMVRDMQKLLLRAFNLECDNLIDSVRVSSFEKSLERINATSEQISKLGSIMKIYIAPAYVSLKLKELALALDYQQKKQEEKEKLRELKEQQREEARVQKEIEEARAKLKKEKAHYTNALQSIVDQINKNGETPELLEKKAELENQLSETEKAITNVDYREANKKAGYVYVISNIGAFGDNVFKIGMTRRLDPMERVVELGDASVPFLFDVHALIFTEDAPSLEAALHNAFEDKKVNKINPRREFFKVTLNEIKDVVNKNFDSTVEWIDIPEAEQYRQSLLIEKQQVHEA